MKVLSFLLILVNSLGFSQDLKLYLYIPKTTYVVGEFVEIGFSFINESDHIVSNEPYHPVTIKVFNENGKELPQGGWNTNTFSSYKNLFKPREEDYLIVNMNDSWGARRINLLDYPHFDKGKYKVEVAYYSGGPEPQRLYFEFEVIEPKGMEEIIYKKYLSMISAFHTKEFNHEKAALFFEELRTKYPSSLYMPLIYHIFL